MNVQYWFHNFRKGNALALQLQTLMKISQDTANFKFNSQPAVHNDKVVNQLFFRQLESLELLYAFENISDKTFYSTKLVFHPQSTGMKTACSIGTLLLLTSACHARDSYKHSKGKNHSPCTSEKTLIGGGK
jgi:hypothetical protein